ALMAGHSHPAVVRAVESRLRGGTAYGMPHDMEWELADEICKRYPVDMVRFGCSGTEATMHAVRLARAAAGRDRIIKFEGAYHGLHDAALVSVKPREGFGSIEEPTPVPGGAGIPTAHVANTLVATFNDLDSVERQFEKHPGEVAALICEPIMMNVGMCLPEDGFLQGLRELTRKHGALLIFDEVKTGAKLARGGACEYYGVKPDIVCLAKSIGGGLPLSAFGATRTVMEQISRHKVFHGGTYNTNPLSMAAGLATFREVLTLDAYQHVDRLNKRLLEAYQRLLDGTGLKAYMAGAGANGVIMFRATTVRNYRDWLEVDTDLWRHYWFAMVNRGVLPQPYWWDEQWTISVQHTDADIDRHIAAFQEVAPALVRARKEREHAAAVQ
ncbi:MAG TPA: aminotransferase class III-fold pyridoxal phosphate-dependent enzyme, partial [Candidatus Acidoferrales bacterium]|nr:aminotransferase class III-fold pyridoxal phosphate-dependent enzyme [Candidatus Acidoferrales bacterium]